MLDFAKLYCDLHPNQIITNFCQKQTCMVGLCATCICTHTQYHITNKSTPQYQNIRSTYSSMHEMIRKKISGLENQKNRIDKISDFIKQKRKTVKQNIEDARKSTISAINTFFQNKEKIMMRQIQSQQKKTGLHCQSRMDSLMNSLNRETGTLISSAQQLNSQNFLESYQRIKTQIIANASRLQEDVSRQLDRNQNFQTIIDSNNNYVQLILNALQESLRLSFKMNPRQLRDNSQKKQPFVTNSPTTCNQKGTSRFGCSIQENKFIPSNISRPSSCSNQNNFSAISFCNVPDMIKQSTAKFNDQGTVRQTTKSISIPEDQYNQKIVEGRQKKSFINDLYKSDIIGSMDAKNIKQSQILKQKDINERNERSVHQSLNKSLSNNNRNHQSQIIVIDKPFGSQCNGNWNNSKIHNQSLNYSMIENLQQQNWQDPKINQYSQANFSTYKPQFYNQNKLMQSGQKFNFVPQMLDPNQFKQGLQNQSFNDCKKVRKSGLSVLRANTLNSTSRSKLQGE